MPDTRASLELLYPFLHGKRKDAEAENQALLESVRQKVLQSIAEKQRFFDSNGMAVLGVAKAMAMVYRNGHRMFSMGNGGSSCDASHFAVEFQHPVTAGRPALPVINLAMDNAMISAVANDIGVKHIFARQLGSLSVQGDGVIGFSASGNSENLLEAFRIARKTGLTTFGFAGGNGGDMKSSGLIDHMLLVETDSIHRVQEVHVAAYHILWDLVHTILADDRGKLAGGE